MTSDPLSVLPDLQRNTSTRHLQAAFTPPQPFVKRQKVSVAGFLGESDDEGDDDNLPAAAAQNELEEYLKLEQVSSKVNPCDWWKEKKDVFPNLEVMARQYLGAPASSASVERLFSSVGVAFSDKRKSAHSATLESIMFARENL